MRLKLLSFCPNLTGCQDEIVCILPPGAFLIVVGRFQKPLIVDEIAGIFLCFYSLKSPRSLGRNQTQSERSSERVSAYPGATGVGLVLLGDEFGDAAEVVLNMGDVASL